MSVETICDSIGRARIAAVVGVKRTAVSNAVRDNSFPAAWYAVIKQLCADVGLDCSDELFSFRAPQAVEPETSREGAE